MSRRLAAEARGSTALRAGRNREKFSLRSACALCGAAAILLLPSGCAKRKKIPAAAPPAIGTVEVGIASWYGHPYHGRPSSSGEIYDMEKLTAAHRTLPFGTIVRVLDLDNDRTVEVRINDRGPFVDGRIIDLSHAAARAIGMIGPGTARVRLEVIALASPSPSSYFAVQVGAFRQRANAERVQAQLRREFGAAQLQFRDGKPAVWRVLVGHEATPQQAGSLAGQLRAKGREAFVVRVEAPAGDL